MYREEGAGLVSGLVAGQGGPRRLIMLWVLGPDASFYQLSGTQHLKERKLGCYPTSLSYYPNGEYLVVGGSDKKTTLCTREAVKLKDVCQIDEWVWSTAVRTSIASDSRRFLRWVDTAVGRGDRADLRARRRQICSQGAHDGRRGPPHARREARAHQDAGLRAEGGYL